MVCKEDVVTWFKSLKSYKRIDVMCSLLNVSLPFELRFLGTCLEDLGKRDFHDLRNPENGANSSSEVSSLDSQCIGDKRARTKLALYLSLLRSCNYECANALYKLLANVEEVNNILQLNSVGNTEDETMEELILLYTLALNHPAFSFEQKRNLGSIFTKLQEEENRLSTLKRSSNMVGSVGLEAQNEKVPLQYRACTSPEQGNIHLISNTSHCTPLSTAPWSQVVLSTNDPQSSPLVSRTSSPCQSNSPSRSGSPGKTKTMPVVANFQRPPPRPESGDPLRETLGTVEQLNMIRRYGGTEGNLTPGLMYTVTQPPNVLCTGTPACYTCLIGSRGPHNKSLQPQFIDQMKALRLDSEASLHTSNSSGSDSASDHSPPDTPSLSISTDRGPPPKDVGPGEMWNSIGSEEQQRIGDGNDERRIGLTHPPHGRARGLGRSNRSNPPGIQTVPRGRGPNHSNRRRDIGSTNAVNGGPEERKVYSGSDNGGPFTYSSTTPSQYLPPTHYLRSAAFPFGPGSFIRTATYPFGHPNGDISYQYPPPPTHQSYIPSAPAPAPAPNHISYSVMSAPPPKISCYNCGSQNHLPNDCQDPTIEEVTKQGQYRLDYNPYPKSGECASGNQDK